MTTDGVVATRDNRRLIAVTLTAIGIAVAALAFALGMIFAGQQGPSGGDAARVREARAIATTSTTANTTSTSTTTSTTAANTTTTATMTLPPAITAPPPTAVVDGDEGVAPDVEVPDPACVHGSVSIEDIRWVHRGDGEYAVTATFVNGTDVVWDMIGASLVFSTSDYADRAKDYFSVYPPVEEVRPAERMPMEGTFSLWPADQKIASVWWDADHEYALTAFPRVAGEWVPC